MKRQKKRNAKGFTLIEVMVTIAIIAIIVPILYNFMSFGNTIFFKGTAKAENQNDVNLIAYKISNQLRTVSDISLTAKTGYTEYNVKTDYPDLDSIVYKLSKVNDSYLLNFNITEDDHQVISEIELNNVKAASIGTSNDKVWVLYSENVSLKPTIVIGNASKLFRIGDPTTTITFPVKTTNIPNNAVVTATFQSSHTGLDIPSSPIVNANNAELKITVNTNAGVGAYNFKLSYPGANDVIGTIQILDHVNIYTIIFDKNGGDTQANPTSIQVQEGVSIGTAMPADPSRSGFSFIGWNEHALGTGTVVNESSSFISDATVYAQWLSLLPTDQEIVTAVKSSLGLTASKENNSVFKIKLPTTGGSGTTITWTYSISDAIGSNSENVVSLINIDNNVKTIYTSTITAKISKGAISDTVVFQINIQRTSNGNNGIVVTIVKK